MERGGGQGTRHLKFHPRAGESTKGYKSAISEIATDTFNTGQICRAVHAIAKERRKLSTTDVSEQRIFGGRDG